MNAPVESVPVIQADRDAAQAHYDAVQLGGLGDGISLASRFARHRTNQVAELVEALGKAASTVGAFYQWVDMIEAEGGATNIAGVAKCNAFLASMKKNRPRVENLVMEPARKALPSHKGEQP